MAQTYVPSDTAALDLFDRITRQWARLAVLFAISHVVFAAVPSADLWISAVFYTPQEGFLLGQHAVLQVLRDIMWNGVLLAFFGTVVMCVMPRRWGIMAAVPKAVWFFCATLFLLGPLVLANGLFKAFWGRARPRNTDAFGGDGAFTPPFQMTDQCAANCSFVSGEASGVVTLAIVVFAVTHFYKPAGWVMPVRGIIVLVAVLGSAFRVLKGGHYLSDVWFAALFMAVVALGLAWVSRALIGRSAGTSG